MWSCCCLFLSCRFLAIVLSDVLSVSHRIVSVADFILCSVFIFIIALPASTALHVCSQRGLNYSFRRFVNPHMVLGWNVWFQFPNPHLFKSSYFSMFHLSICHLYLNSVQAQINVVTFPVCLWCYLCCLLLNCFMIQNVSKRTATRQKLSTNYGFEV